MIKKHYLPTANDNSDILIAQHLELARRFEPQIALGCAYAHTFDLTKKMLAYAELRGPAERKEIRDAVTDLVNSLLDDVEFLIDESET
jgi:hypothetical protein